MLGRLADLLLPPVCIACRTRIGSHGLLCGACFARIDFIAPPFARGSAFRCHTTRAKARSRRRRSPRRQSTTARGPRRAIRRPCASLSRASNIAIGRRASLVRPLAQQGRRRVACRRRSHRAGPALPARLWWRRFNQSAMLAQALGRLTGIAVDCFVLKRVRRTASQVGLTADQRRRNVAGAFKVDQGAGRQPSGASEDRGDRRRHHHRGDAAEARAPASTCWRWRVPSSPPPSCSRRPRHVRLIRLLPKFRAMECRVKPGMARPCQRRVLR